MIFFKLYYNFIYRNKKTEVFSDNDNPCVKCGACCAFFVVNVPPKDLSSNGGTVPIKFIEYKNNKPYMCGGTKLGGRCSQLSGTVGKETRCSIYEVRSSICRDFQAFVDGEQNYRCKRARAHHGLPPNISFKKNS